MLGAIYHNFIKGSEALFIINQLAFSCAGSSSRFGLSLAALRGATLQPQRVGLSLPCFSCCGASASGVAACGLSSCFSFSAVLSPGLRDSASALEAG